MATTRSRYYAYGDIIGRMRIPHDNEPDAVKWAQHAGAVNVVREDGPASKPTNITFVWKQESDPFAPFADRLFNLVSEHFPNATIREIREATTAIMNMIKEEG